MPSSGFFARKVLMNKSEKIIMLLAQETPIEKIAEQVKVSKPYIYSVKSRLAKKAKTARVEKPLRFSTSVESHGGVPLTLDMDNQTISMPFSHFSAFMAATVKSGPKLKKVYGDS